MGSVGLCIGALVLLAPRSCERLLGLSRGSLRGPLRHAFVVREFALGSALVRAGGRGPEARRLPLLALVVSQLADAGVATWLWRRDSLSRRGFLLVVGGALPTAAAAALLRRREAG